MIGNDIVDLSLAASESKWQHPRFINKLFTPSEQELLLDGTDKFARIWQLWAMKEAAYKAYVQLHPSRFFNPTAFECSGIQGVAEVSYKDFRIEVNTTSYGDYVFSETKSVKNMKNRIIEFTSSNISTQRAQLRQYLFSDLSQSLGLPSGQLSLSNNTIGVPVLLFKNGELSVPLSITHHGKYGAYSYVFE